MKAKLMRKLTKQFKSILLLKNCNNEYNIIYLKFIMFNFVEEKLNNNNLKLIE